MFERLTPPTNRNKCLNILTPLPTWIMFKHLDPPAKRS